MRRFKEDTEMLRLASMMGLLVAIGCSSKDDGAGDTGSTGGGDPTDVCGTPQALSLIHI